MIATIVLWLMVSLVCAVLAGAYLRRRESRDLRSDTWELMRLLEDPKFRFQSEGEALAAQRFLALGDITSAETIIRRQAELSGVDRE